MFAPEQEGGIPQDREPSNVSPELTRELFVSLLKTPDIVDAMRHAVSRTDVMALSVLNDNVIDVSAEHAFHVVYSQGSIVATEGKDIRPWKESEYNAVPATVEGQRLIAVHTHLPSFDPFINPSAIENDAEGNWVGDLFALLVARVQNEQAVASGSTKPSADRPVTLIFQHNWESNLVRILAIRESVNAAARSHEETVIWLLQLDKVLNIAQSQDDVISFLRLAGYATGFAEIHGTEFFTRQAGLEDEHIAAIAGAFDDVSPTSGKD